MHLSRSTTDHLPDNGPLFLDALDAAVLGRLECLVGDARGWAVRTIEQEPPVHPLFWRKDTLHALLERKGKGGFAEAWTVRAEDKKHEMIGKFLHARPHDPRFHSSAERMRGEGQILERLEIPGVPTLCARNDDPPYLLMESIDGLSWRDMLRQYPEPPLRLILRCALDGAETLSKLHARDIVHSDIKPENMMFGRSVNASWRSWIIDFGLAVDTSSASTRVTTEGQTVGTHGFLDPRHIGQALARDTSGDIYALGATLYEWYAGAPLFTKERWREVLMTGHDGADTFDEHVKQRIKALPGTHRAFETLLQDMLLYERPERARPSAREIASTLRTMIRPVSVDGAASLEEAVTCLGCEQLFTRRRFFWALGTAAAGIFGMASLRTTHQEPMTNTAIDHAPVKVQEHIPELALKYLHDEVRLELHGVMALQIRRKDATVFGNTQRPDHEWWMADIQPEVLCNALERMKPGVSSGLPKRIYSCYFSKTGDTSTALVTPRGIVHTDSFLAMNELDTERAEALRQHLRRWPTEGKLIDCVRSSPTGEDDARAKMQKANEYLRQTQQKVAVRVKTARK